MRPQERLEGLEADNKEVASTSMEKCDMNKKIRLIGIIAGVAALLGVVAVAFLRAGDRRVTAFLDSIKVGTKE